MPIVVYMLGLGPHMVHSHTTPTPCTCHSVHWSADLVRHVGHRLGPAAYGALPTRRQNVTLRRGGRAGGGGVCSVFDFTSPDEPLGDIYLVTDAATDPSLAAPPTISGAFGRARRGCVYESSSPMPAAEVLRPLYRHE